jgi:hypothetical protein
MAKRPYSTAKTADEAAAQASAKRGVGKPGFAIGSSKTSPVPGMSRTKAAINSLTEKGRAENVGRVEAVWNSEKFNTGKTRIGPLARGGAGGAFIENIK